MQIDQPELDSLHGVLSVPARFPPDLKSPIHNILVPLDAGSEHLSFVLLRGELDELISLPFKLLSHWDLVFQLLPCCFKLVIDITVANCVENPLQKHLRTGAFNFLHH